MSTHRAIATTTKGVIDVVQLPTPAPGSDDVLIKIAYTALIPFDTYQIDRAYAVSDYPHVLGFAASGFVKAVGTGVTDLKEGDRVAAFTFNKGLLQEYALVTRNGVAKLPEDVSLAEAASMPDNYATAMMTLFGAVNLALPLPETFPAPSAPENAQQIILVYGAGASSGQYMVQMFKLAGYTNIFVTASPRHHAFLRELGAKQCFDYRLPDLAEQILKASGGDKMAIVVDTIAAEPSMKAFSPVMDKNTRLALLMPIKRGSSVTNHPDSEMTVTLQPWVIDVSNGATILPVFTFKMHEDPVARANFMPKILPQLLRDKVLRANPVILFKAEDGPLLDRVKKALNLHRESKVSGEKVVVETTF